MNLDVIFHRTKNTYIFCGGFMAAAIGWINLGMGVGPSIKTISDAPTGLKPFAALCATSKIVGFSTMKAVSYGCAWPIALWSIYHRNELFRATGEVQWIKIFMEPGSAMSYKDKYLHIPRYDLLAKNKQ